MYKLQWVRVRVSVKWIGQVTWEVAFGAQVADGQSEDGQFVEFGNDGLLKRKQRCEQFQFGVESLAMSLAWIALRQWRAYVFRRRFQP